MVIRRKGGGVRGGGGGEKPGYLSATLPLFDHVTLNNSVYKKIRRVCA